MNRKPSYFVLTAVIIISFASMKAASAWQDAMNQPAHLESGLTQVFLQYGFTGRNTVFVMIDDGCDYRHPDFIDDDGASRIAYLYDMLNPAGASAPNNPYGIGTIFTQTDINQALKNGGTLLSEERHGHGTATTGIAVGDGSGVPGRPFRGVATEANLIVIKAYQRSFPAFNGQPGQVGVFDSSNLAVALEFAAEKIEAMGMRGVAVINAGTLGGPADGSSEINRAQDAFVERGHVLVCGTGDEGGQGNHKSGAVQENTTTSIRIRKGESGLLRFTMWYSEDDRFDIEIVRPNGSSVGPFPSPPTASSIDDRSLGDMFYYHRGKDQDWFGASSHRRMLAIDLVGSPGIYEVQVFASQVGLDGAYHAVLNPSFFFSDNFFLEPIPGTSFHDFAAAQQVICPGDYVVQNTWVDLDGFPRQILGEGNPGRIWIGSSVGPTQDGRLGIDFAGPGELLWAPFFPGSYYSAFRFNMVAGGNALYGRQNAVSAVNPLVAGLICLMFEANPNLTAAQIKTVLQQTARGDVFTGQLPNTTWGYGKLDALAAVQRVLLGDVNADGVFDLADVGPFANVILQNEYELRADINGDGLVDLLDVNPFVDRLMN